MKRIRKILILGAILLFIIYLMCCFKIISLTDAINNILFGCTASIITALFLEILSNLHEQKKILNNFFWQGVVKYKEDLEELFLYSRDFYYMEEIFKDIDKNEGDWNKYLMVYSKHKDLLDSKINGCCKEILSNGLKYKNHVAFLSDVLSNVDRKNIFFNKNKAYEECYKVYNLIENINWTLCEACEHIQNIEQIGDFNEKMCSKLIICRYIGYTYCVNYDRNITDIDESGESSMQKENNDIIVQQEFDKILIKLRERLS